jgi:RHH-type transcriptional regulator, proline utilization regulon repressor / proline dehydrogenase / delta 1-pyrroline-5-carboxylate dehydrogenase
VVAQARPWVQAVREQPAPFWAMESLLREYPISSAEGLALMRLAEALLRVPDAETAIALTADQLGRPTSTASARPRARTRCWPACRPAPSRCPSVPARRREPPGPGAAPGLAHRGGGHRARHPAAGPAVRAGPHIGEAMAEAAAQRGHARLRFSYDMLGEGARTEPTPSATWPATGTPSQPSPAAAGARPMAADGISIKLSALFSALRGRPARARVRRAAAARGAWSTRPRAPTSTSPSTPRRATGWSCRWRCSRRWPRASPPHPQWQGFGLAVQAYQTRALAVVDEVARIARRHGLRFMVRLVKGAYWDGEVKRAQEAAACPATRCSRTSTTPTSATWPARRG